MSSLIRDLMDGGLDAESSAPDLLRQVRMLNSSTLLALVLVPPLGIFYAQAASPAFLWIYFGATLAWLGNSWLLRRSHRPQSAGERSIWILFGLLSASFSLLGGIDTPVFAWVLVLPLAGATLGDRNASWRWTAIGGVTCVAFWALPQLGIPMANELRPEYHAIVPLVSSLAAFSVVAILIRIWFNLQRRLEEDLEASLLCARLEAENVALLREASEASNASGGFAAVAERCLARICDTMQVSAARVWAVDGEPPALGGPLAEQEARGGPISLPSPASSRELIGASLLPRVRDLASDARAPHSLLVQPIQAGTRTAGVLELHTGHSRRSPPALLELMRHVAAQLGHVAERERAQHEIEQLAYGDPVSGLPNRHAFQLQLDGVLRRAAQRRTQAALLFLDLNGFKRVNDSLGHAAGDALLREVAERIAAAIRRSDHLWRSEARPIARFGGDEFTILLTDLRNSEGAEIAAQRVLDTLETPVRLGEQEVVIGASVGIALYPRDAREPSELVRLADRAMYRAKQRGTNSWERHRGDHPNERIRLDLEAGLRAALERGDITLHYQPIFCARTGQLTGAEALARWQHAERGLLDPSEFIPIAESSGLIVPLGMKMMDRVCAEAARWVPRAPEPFRIAVNLSARQLLRPIVGDLRKLLEQNRCDPSWIELELTESALLVGASAVAERLREVAALGVQLVLDDFGTGFSSLAFLKQLPIARVKIDREFVHGLPSEPNDVAITQAVLGMAHSLGIRVVAEGVEDEAQQEFLSSRGCDELQGYLLGRPLPAAEFEARWLR